MNKHATVPVLDALAVSQYIASIDVQAVLRAMFKALGAKLAVQPPQTLALFPDNKGDFISYFGALASQDTFGVKLSPYIPTTSKPIITAWTMLMSMRTGQPLLLCDSAALTVERTAGTTALAIDALAGQDARRLALIGTGPVAKAHLRYARSLRAWKEILVYSPRLRQQGDATKADFMSLDPRVTFPTSIEEATRAVAELMRDETGRWWLIRMYD